MKKTFKIHGTGCCLIDYLYTGMDFSSPMFRKYQDDGSSSGGIEPGKLDFSEDLEAFSGRSFDTIKQELLEGKTPDTVNLGGPAIVALMNAAQMLQDAPSVELYGETETAFWGISGKDAAGKQLKKFIIQSLISHLHIKDGEKDSPNTIVLSDPNYRVHGERAFINTIGAAGELGSSDLPEEFFDADMVLFGGTGLVPELHDNLTSLLAKAKEKGCFTIVGTVYDFRNQKKDPTAAWPLGKGNSFPLIVLLFLDVEEAKRLTGTQSLKDAVQELIRKGSKAFIITQGAESVYLHAQGDGWKDFSGTMPVCDYITKELTEHPERRGDTTGCGDNYVGGVTADIARQLQNLRESEKTDTAKESGVLDILRANMLGSVSGGYACFYDGGAYFESAPGQKLKGIKTYIPKHCSELGIEVPPEWKTGT
jgi:sugar/nucleoside kinase (ribokinase family)